MWGGPYPYSNMMPNLMGVVKYVSLWMGKLFQHYLAITLQDSLGYSRPLIILKFVVSPSVVVSYTVFDCFLWLLGLKMWILQLMMLCYICVVKCMTVPWFRCCRSISSIPLQCEGPESYNLPELKVQIKVGPYHRREGWNLCSWMAISSDLWEVLLQYQLKYKIFKTKRLERL